MKKSCVEARHVADVTLSDSSLTEQIYLRRSWAGGKTVQEEEARIPLPEDIVSKLSELTGDEKGRVTVGAELTSSIEFGMKAGAFVSIGVKCDSSAEVLKDVHDMLFPLAQRLVIEDHAEMSDVRDSMVIDHKRLGNMCPRTEKDERMEARASQRTKESQRPKRSSTKPKDKKKSKLRPFRSR